MSIPLKPATPEEIAALRKRIEAPLKDSKKNPADQRDVDRLMNDDEYAALFVRWSKTEEDCNKLVLKCFAWRNESKINDVTEKDLEEALKKGNVFIRGRAIDGSRVLHLRTGKMPKRERETNMKLVTFWLERIQRKEPGKQITLVMDTTGSSMMDSDMGFVSFIIECFMSYFPCLLQKLIIYNLPSLLNSIWKLISKMLSAEQREATVMCSKEEILKYIDADNALVALCGKDKFEYSYPPFPDDLE